MIAVKTYTVIVIALLLISISCADKVQIIEPLQNTQSSEWHVIPALASLDIRYMIKHNGALYLAAIDPNIITTHVINDTLYYVGDRGVIYKTTDGIAWTKIKGFNITVGPMTFRDDTLYCLTNYHIWKLLQNGEWQIALPTPPRLGDASADGDMVFIDDSLYVMQTFFIGSLETYRIRSDGSFIEIAGPDGLSHFAGAKYLITTFNGKEVAYLRPQWDWGQFFIFDGNSYTKIVDGLSEYDLHASPSNSMVIKNDTLFAGFISPPRIEILENDQTWFQYLDTLPSWKLASTLNPPLKTQPTGIAFAGDKIYVATNCLGIIEWSSEKGWQQRSKGLIPGLINGVVQEDLYYPIPFIEYFNNKLIVAYGKPGYGPWGEFGVYTFNLK
jgi:hypothetical protein